MIEFINSSSVSWFEWMFSMFWQVSLLVIIIGGIDLLIRNWAWPQVRYGLWTIVLLKLVLPPTLTFSVGIIPNVRLEIDKKFIASNIIENPEDTYFQGENKTPVPANTKNNAKEDAKKLTEDGAQVEEVKAELNWKTYLMVIWLFGIVIFGAVLINRITKLKKWHREQEEKKNIPKWFHDVLINVGKILTVDRLPSIVFSDEAYSPAVYGVFRPVLLLPKNYINDLNEEEAEHILLHELAHIKRGDLIIHGICLILQIIYWFNPFLIWMRKQMKHVREICCDITIANILREKTKHYKETLINTARELLTENTEPAMGLLGLFEEPFQLIARLKWLNKETWKSRIRAYSASIVSALLFAAFVVPMGELKFPGHTTFVENTDADAKDISYKLQLERASEEVNNAFINWDFKTIRNFYTDDAIIDEIQHPTVKGIDNIIAYFKQAKESGRKFNSLKNFITDYWLDGNQLHVVESFFFDISIIDPELRLSGSGSSYSIWEIQDDDSIKIKYSILNLDDMLSNMIKGVN